MQIVEFRQTDIIFYLPNTNDIQKFAYRNFSNKFKFFYTVFCLKLQLSDLLIKPVQRLTKYVLLLHTITKQIEQAGLVEDVACMKEACNVMNVGLVVVAN